MNITEFAALKVGDKMEIPANGSRGVVTATDDTGVKVVWGSVPGSVEFRYPVNSTAWMQWSKVDE